MSWYHCLPQCPRGVHYPSVWMHWSRCLQARCPDETSTSSVMLHIIATFSTLGEWICLHATQPDTVPSAVVASRPSQVLQLTHYPARHASISSHRMSSISGAATYILPSQTRFGQQSSHLVHLRCCNLHPTQPDTLRSAVIASRPSQVLQLTSYPARHASVSSRISSISGATTYILYSQTCFD